jgi:hypothetical protein
VGRPLWCRDLSAAGALRQHFSRQRHRTRAPLWNRRRVRPVNCQRLRAGIASADQEPTASPWDRRTVGTARPEAHASSGDNTTRARRRHRAFRRGRELSEAYAHAWTFLASNPERVPRLTRIALDICKDDRLRSGHDVPNGSAGFQPVPSGLGASTKIGSNLPDEGRAGRRLWQARGSLGFRGKAKILPNAANSAYTLF